MLYIGRSLQPVKRLRHHVSINGLNEIGTLGKLIFCNLPNSLTIKAMYFPAHSRSDPNGYKSITMLQGGMRGNNTTTLALPLALLMSVKQRPR